MKPDLRKAFETALNEKVVITKDKKEIVMTKAVLGIQQLVNQFAKGDRYARRDLFQYAALLALISKPKSPSKRRLASTNKRSSTPTCDVAPPRTAKMPVEPVFDENGAPLPVTDRRYIRAQSERHVAWQKKQAGS
jgi:hypothetical protein